MSQFSSSRTPDASSTAHSAEQGSTPWRTPSTRSLTSVTYATTPPEALSGFGDPTVIFIASLFVVSESLDATGVTAWAGQKVIAQAGTRRLPLLFVIGALVAAATALISINGAVAALLPLVVVV